MNKEERRRNDSKAQLGEKFLHIYKLKKKKTERFFITTDPQKGK